MPPLEAVMVALPLLMALTMPLLTVATDGLLLFQVIEPSPPLVVSVDDSPTKRLRVLRFRLTGLG